MNLPEMPLLFAEVVPDEIELTAGEILAGICFLAAMAGSLAVIGSWWSRFSRGEPVIPQARRPLLWIPLPVMIFGLIIGIMMAGLAILSSAAIDTTVKTPDSNDESVADEGPSDKVNQPKINGDAALLDKSTHEDDVTVRTEPFSESTAASETLEFVEVLWETVRYDMAMILILGLPVLVLRLRQHSTVHPNGVIHSSTASGVSVDQDLDSHDTNPYMIPGTAVVALPAMPGGEPVHDMSIEPWQIGRELRFAGETCLAAWLPTAILRLTMVMILEDEGQHPFLEMIMNGVGLEVLLLIAFTAVVLAPLMEELLYRVVILGGLLSLPDPIRMSPSFAIGITSVLFAFAHGFPDSVALLPLAAAIGWTYHQRRSYRTVVLVHFLFNGFNILIAGLGML